MGKFKPILKEWANTDEEGRKTKHPDALSHVTTDVYLTLMNKACLIFE